MVGCDFKRMFHSWQIYVSIIAGLFMLLRPLMELYGTWKEYTPMTLLSMPLAVSDFTPFAAVFCVLPFADSFCEDFSSHYLCGILQRVGVRRYAILRCISVAISGGLVMGVIMLMTILMCVAGAGRPDTAESVAFLSGSVWMRMGIILTGNGILLYLCRILLAFLFGALWALVGLVISSFVPNRYVSMIAPFVLYQALWFFLDENVLNPVYLFRGDFSHIPSFAFIVLWQTLCIGLCVALSCLGIRRRMES